MEDLCEPSFLLKTKITGKTQTSKPNNVEKDLDGTYCILIGICTQILSSLMFGDACVRLTMLHFP